MESAVSEEDTREEEKMRRENVSVCMACYNGEAYIKEQIESILPQLIEGDELIVIDDGSADKTAEIVLEIKDTRIKYFRNSSNAGVNKSFERGIVMAKNDYIFMADQDDIWTEGRLDRMLEKLQLGSLLVSGNSVTIDAKGEKSDYILGDLLAGDSKQYSKNIIRIFTGKAYYYGCAMAFRKKLNSVILPFPDYIESHDLWIAMAANMLKSNVHLEETVLKRRIHGKNASVVQRKLTEKLYARWIFLKSYVVLKRRISKNEI